MNEHMAINNGGCMITNNIRVLTEAWLNSSWKVKAVLD